MSESSKNALNSTEAAILVHLTSLEQNVTSRCRILSAAFCWKWLQNLLISLGFLMAVIFSGWGLLALAENKVTSLHREITELSERKEKLEAESARLWATFKGLEPYHVEGKDYLLTPKGWTILDKGTVGERTAWIIVRK